jgi:hypothetical protein
MAFQSPLLFAISYLILTTTLAIGQRRAVTLAKWLDILVLSFFFCKMEIIPAPPHGEIVGIKRECVDDTGAWHMERLTSVSIIPKKTRALQALPLSSGHTGGAAEPEDG